MGAFIWFFAITIMFSLTHCYELSILLDIPHVMDQIKDMATHAFTYPRAEKDDDMENPTLSERLTKISWDMFSYMSSLLNSMNSRRSNYEQMKPNVEVGPGVVKSEIVSHPPNFFVNRLKYLLQMKQREEENHKPPIKQDK